MAASGPSERTIKQLFALSSNRCAFPECQTPIIDASRGTIMAEVCHIRSRRPRGPRYDNTQTKEQRNSFDNLVIMCRNHHKVIDGPENLDEFTVERLEQIKREHEDVSRTEQVNLEAVSRATLTALRLTGTIYELGSTHMDFRQAQFRVGGEGGSFGGGGGGGGVLTIVGMSRLPAEVSVDLNGQPGQSPGGGGGGAGAVRFEGRPATSRDFENGLRASGFFTANAANTGNNLLNVLGVGWSFCPVPSLPRNLTLTFASIIELGSLQPPTLLRCDIEVLAPSGDSVAVESMDIEVPDSEDLVRRISRSTKVSFTANEYGVWTVTLKSGGTQLASILFEIREGDVIP
jgi:hypothetical protein